MKSKVILAFCYSFLLHPTSTYAFLMKDLLSQLHHSLNQLSVSLPKTPQLSQVLNFTLTTCNVLYEPYYVQYVRPNTNLIPISDRKKAFQEALKDSTALANADILCFQEWPYKSGHILDRVKNEQILVNNKPTTKNQYFDKDQQIHFINYLINIYSPIHYHYVVEDAQYDGLLMVINKNLFTVLHFEVKPFDDPNKKMLVVIVQPKGFNKKMGIITAHIPYNKMTNSAHLINAIKAEYLRIYPDIDSWILCGDFNYNIEDQNTVNQQQFAQLKTFFPNMANSVSSLLQGTLLPSTTFGAPGHFEHDDYVFYSPVLKMTKIALYPTDKKNLIRHQGQDPTRNTYFSDHAILRVQFQLLEKS